MNGSDYQTSIYEKYINAISEYTHLSKEEIEKLGGHESTMAWEHTFTDDIICDPIKIRKRYEESDIFLYRNPVYYKNREEDGFGWFLELLKDAPKNSSILDFGCGVGIFTELLLRRGFINISMVDVNCPTTTFAKWFFKDRATVYNDPDNIIGKYDFITSNSTFEHLPDPIFYTYMLLDHLNPNGKLIVSMATNIGYPHLKVAIDKFDECKQIVESHGGYFRD